MKTIAIIPLRGSDREAQTTPEALLCGKPVLAYTIEAARAAMCLDRIIVSTDSPAVAEIARQYGAEAPFLRPEELTRSDVPMTRVLQHALEWLEHEEQCTPDIVVLLESTHPIRPAGLIDNVVSVLLDEELDTVFAAREERHRFWKYGEGGLAQIAAEEGDHTRQQVLPLYKELAGMATAVRAEVLRRGERAGSRVGLVPIHSHATVVDLHDEDGWWLASRLIAAEAAADSAAGGETRRR